MPSENKARVAAAGFSSALTYPFSGASQKDGQSYSDETVQGWWQQELTEELLRNPVYGVAVARALSESKFSDGSTLLDLNPWLGEFVQKYDAAFQGDGKGNGYFLTKETADGPILVSDEYRRYAVGTRWLLGRFVIKGVSKLYAEKHWGLRPANDLQPSRIKAEAFEEPEDRDALAVSFLTKSGKNVLIIGFNVRPTPKAKALAEQEQVEIRKYNIIYKCVEEINQAMEGMLQPDTKEEVIGQVEVRNTFKVPKIGVIAGCSVSEGIVRRSASVNLVRDGIVLFTGKISSLKRFKDDAKEVSTGYECGIGLENWQDIQVGDKFEVFEVVEVAKKLGKTIAQEQAEAAKKNVTATGSEGAE